MGGARESGPAGGSFPLLGLQGKGCPALGGDLGFVSLHSWSWGLGGNHRDNLLPSLPFTPYPWAQALLDGEESGLLMCSPEVFGSGRDFKQLLIWALKPSPHQSSRGSSGNLMHCALCNTKGTLVICAGHPEGREGDADFIRFFKILKTAFTDPSLASIGLVQPPHIHSFRGPF